ncbi:hypothetical protein T4D_4039 [Trichinella pseudospiralis]|uniref:Uncharacterized protein n=1 Tax=Trichinella pseudospiralis TaxID=6337 RepID=A0A0V1F7D2_TRIPS|nr:hypothetical protein T4D_4039 [Trichinella pseudospiralis]
MPLMPLPRAHSNNVKRCKQRFHSANVNCHQWRLRSGDGILSIEPDNLQQNASVRRTHSTAAQASPSYTKLQARALKQIYSASERFLIADVDSGAAENLA